MSIGEVKAAIRQGNESLGTAEDIFKQAAAAAGEAIGVVRHTLQGSTDSDVTGALSTFDEAIDEVDRTLGRYQEATKQANKFLASLG